MGRHKHIKKTKGHKAQTEAKYTKKHTRPYIQLYSHKIYEGIFLLFLFSTIKSSDCRKNVVVLSLSDEEAFDRGGGILPRGGGLSTAYGISSGGV